MNLILFPKVHFTNLSTTTCYVDFSLKPNKLAGESYNKRWPKFKAILHYSRFASAAERPIFIT